jgi:hypothetical protein
MPETVSITPKKETKDPTNKNILIADILTALIIMKQTEEEKNLRDLVDEITTKAAYVEEVYNKKNKKNEIVTI